MWQHLLWRQRYTVSVRDMMEIFTFLWSCNRFIQMRIWRVKSWTASWDVGTLKMAAAGLGNFRFCRYINLSEYACISSMSQNQKLRLINCILFYILSKYLHLCGECHHVYRSRTAIFRSMLGTTCTNRFEMGGGGGGFYLFALTETLDKRIFGFIWRITPFSK